MKPSLPSEYNDSEQDDQDREIIEILKQLGKSNVAYPPDQLAARRAKFLTQVEQLGAADQEVVDLLKLLKSAQARAEYPPELLATRRSAFLLQMQSIGRMSVLDRVRASLQRIIQPNPTSPPAGLRQMSFVLAGLVAAVILWSLFFRPTELSSRPSPLPVAGTSTSILPTSTGSVAMTICKPGDQMPSCPSGASNPGQDLADAGNGSARPAISNEARSNAGGVYKAAYLNDGRGGAGWVSNSPDSWIKIDLGEVRTINTVSLQPGSLAPASDNVPGQFVIAVALSDVYADGNSSNDYQEYATVFHSAQTGFNGRVSEADTILTRFPPVKARFVKITFAKTGAAIDEVGVFLAPSPVLAEQPTRKPQDEVPGISSTPIPTNTASVVYTPTALATNTSLPSDTPIPTLTNTPLPSDTSTPLPTDTFVPVPTIPLPSDTPIPLPTLVPPTEIPATVQSTPASINDIVVTGHDQTLTYTCNGDSVEIRGSANTVTLLGSCSSITVTGNGNLVLWEFGSPVITNQGTNNIIQQL